MSEKIKVAGYVKLAKLWEKRKADALPYHKKYYEDKFANSDKFKLVDVYVDITGNKQIAKRVEMIRLLQDCKVGKVKCIATQTKAYLAADTREFCYLFKILREFGVDIITEDMDYNIDTTVNAEHQVEELLKMSNKYISLNPSDFEKWNKAIMELLE